LRYLIVELDTLPPNTSSAGTENFKRLDSWRQVCVNLGTYLPQSQLTLNRIINQRGALAYDAEIASFKKVDNPHCSSAPPPYH
jgi:hypothetical protein